MSRADDELCPQCGGVLEGDEADVGVGIIRGPLGCPACHWIAPAVTFPPSTVKADVVAVGAPSDLLDSFTKAGLTVRVLRTDAEHLADFIAHEDRSTSNPHLQAVAREIQRLQKYTRTTQAAFDDLAVAEERNVWLTSRVDGLLASNNDYLEQARAARRELADARGVNAVIVRQLVTMREALEFYAEEANNHYEPASDDDAKISRVQDDMGTTAEQALQDVIGYNRPAMEPKPEPAKPATEEPMHHATAACRSVGMCGAIDAPGKQACILPTDHDGAHGWDL